MTFSTFKYLEYIDLCTLMSRWLKMWRLILLYGVIFVKADYEVPEAKIEALYPKGFRVSIPDEEGIKLFAFHGKLNEEMEGREGGTFSRDITKAKNGRWTFYDRYTKLKPGDILYYWTYVDYFDGRNKLGYTNDDKMFVVQELIDESIPKMDIRGMSTGCTVTVTNSGSFCKGDVIFNDDFNTEIEKDNLWRVEQRYAEAPDYEFVMYANRPEVLNVGNGILKIRPVLSEQLFGNGFVTSHVGHDFGERCTGVVGSPTCVNRYDAGFILPPIVSAQITTKNKFHFKYGKIEIRAKLPKGEWIYPELYLNPVNEEYGPGYESGQIRIAFVPGNPELNRVLKGGIILGLTQAAKNYGMKSVDSANSWNDDFHKYVVDWKPGSISMSVDDVMYGNISPPSSGFASLSSFLNIAHAHKWKGGSNIAPFDKEMYITVGVGVGGFNFEDEVGRNKPWKNGERLSMKKILQRPRSVEKYMERKQCIRS
ncbi:hypothetical protein NQ318_016132 [Aromia moschata]|uniref:Uncharacterized protein n=1 Tax=Aromia moschata TaxID=1265417 RepID=A0AAV8Y009_9CUCU|nr:hypothetical protein NQ318_016132 [Aromia moschata]